MQKILFITFSLLATVFSINEKAYFGSLCLSRYARQHNANPFNCYQFIQCDLSGRFFIKDCAPGTAWSIQAGVCDHIKNVDCSGRGAGWTGYNEPYKPHKHEEYKKPYYPEEKNGYRDFCSEKRAGEFFPRAEKAEVIYAYKSDQAIQSYISCNYGFGFKSGFKELFLTCEWSKLDKAWVWASDRNDECVPDCDLTQLQTYYPNLEIPHKRKLRVGESIYTKCFELHMDDYSFDGKNEKYVPIDNKIDIPSEFLIDEPIEESNETETNDMKEKMNTKIFQMLPNESSSNTTETEEIKGIHSAHSKKEKESNDQDFETTTEETIEQAENHKIVELNKRSYKEAKITCRYLAKSKSHYIQVKSECDDNCYHEVKPDHDHHVHKRKFQFKRKFEFQKRNSLKHVGYGRKHDD